MQSSPHFHLWIVCRLNSVAKPTMLPTQPRSHANGVAVTTEAQAAAACGCRKTSLAFQFTDRRRGKAKKAKDGDGLAANYNVQHVSVASMGTTIFAVELL